MDLSRILELHDRLTSSALLSIEESDGQLEGSVIVAYLQHLIAVHHAKKIAYLHPNYTANFFTPTEDVLSRISTDRTLYPAAPYLRGDQEFEILLIPFHVRQQSAWQGGEHWMLVIYDNRSAGSRTLCQMYDPMLAVCDVSSPTLKDDYRRVARHILRTVIPNRILQARITLARTPYNRQAVSDFTSCGVFVCFYARQYVENGSVTFIPCLDIQRERQLISQVIRHMHAQQEHARENNLEEEQYPEEEQPPMDQVQAGNSVEEQLPISQFQSMTSEIRMRTRRARRDNDKTLTMMLKRVALSRATMGPEKRQHELVRQQNRMKTKRSRVTVEERERELRDQRDRMSAKRRHETQENRKQDLRTQRERMSAKRRRETPEEHERALIKQRGSMSAKRRLRSQEERQVELAEQRRRMADHRAAQSEAERLTYQEENRERMRRYRTFRESCYGHSRYKEAMLSTDVAYCQLSSFSVECIHCKAVHYAEERTGGQHPADSFNDCCGHGKIRQEAEQASSGIPMFESFPSELKQLFLKVHAKTSVFKFHERIRNLNASFAFASFCADVNKTPPSGVYAFTIGGQVYHKINLAVHPSGQDGSSARPAYAQLYFLDASEAVEYRLTHRANTNVQDSGSALNRELVILIERIIREHNVYAQSFNFMSDVEKQVNVQARERGIQPPRVNLVFKSTDDGDRRFSIPSANEVSAVMVLNADGSIPDNYVIVHPRFDSHMPHQGNPWLAKNEITIRQHGEELCVLSNMDPRIEPFVYPIFFPNGSLGWHEYMRFTTASGSQRRITRLMFAQYRLAFRRFGEEDGVTPQAFNPLHYGEKLFQQYCVDTFIRIERDRIQWIKNNQKKLFSENYAAVNKFLDGVREREHAVLHRKVILPSTFPGAPRFYSECYEDAMALVRRYGTPDLFITITCNPKWPEIQEALRYTVDGRAYAHSAHMRPDIVARVFKLKADQLLKDIYKDKIFGNVASYVSVIEFQKRGLPHMHLLVIMERNDKIITPEQIDDFISAEIPHRLVDSELYRLVDLHMVHEVCGSANPNARCTDPRTKQCRWKYPKKFQDSTTLREGEQPNYRRRDNQAVEGYRIIRKDKNGDRIYMDNRSIAPYNPYLLKRFGCHVNVEYVGGIRAVKYLYKYIYKGHDVAQVCVISDEKSIIYDKCERHIEGRYVSSYEACWRMFEYELQRKSHTVVRLDVHLEGQFRRNADCLPEDLLDVAQRQSTLEAWFELNRGLKEKAHDQALLRAKQDATGHALTDAERTFLAEAVTYHFYWEVPEHYTWFAKTGEWKPLRRATRKIGRMYAVSPCQPDRYHLRLLLVHVKAATSFADLTIVNGIKYASYKAACLALGLTFDDKQWFDGLEEHAQFKMPRAMRMFFAVILMYGEPAEPKRLWDAFKGALAEDFIFSAERQGREIGDAHQQAYNEIAELIDKEAPEGRCFDYWVKHHGMPPVVQVQGETLNPHRTVETVDSDGGAYFLQLNEDQRRVAEAVLQASIADGRTARCFFVDGPGGTGKSFLFRALYYELLTAGKRVRNIASTGIAATLLVEGVTAHKAFALPVPLRPDSESRICAKSAKGLRLAEIDVFFMDEAPMLARYGFECIDRKLRELRKNPNVPFGGAVMVFGGDFRQCLPVQPHANQSELRNLSIRSSALWTQFRQMQLSINMRVLTAETDFRTWVMKIGDGLLPADGSSKVTLPQRLLSSGDLVTDVFGECLANLDYASMPRRAILCPFNREASTHNSAIIDKLPGEYKTYFSFDSFKDRNSEGLQIPPEFLNSLETADLPPHSLKLKVNAVVILLRNLNLSEGLCNGTRIRVTALTNNVVRGKVVTEGGHYNREVSIPRITLETTKGLGFTLTRHQFPLRPAFAITIHKAQGQTFEFVGVDLTHDVFNHGQLYVALSRARSESCLKILLQGNSTKNVVDRVILRNGSSSLRGR